MVSITSVCFDIGQSHTSTSGTVEFVISQTKKLWDEGSDVVLFPEYMWGTFAQYHTPQPDLNALADIFWGQAWPRLQSALTRTGKTVILGSVPRRDAQGKLYNTCPIICSGEVIYQDKLALTPWESMFAGGAQITPFTLPSGQRAAVLICLDCEMPDLITKLKNSTPRLDILFIPSATESLMGVERIARCASARAVELGAVVVTSAICGEVAGYEFLDANIGRTGFYLPSLAGLESVTRIRESEPQTSGYSVDTFKIAQDVFDIARNEMTTTNPANIAPSQDICVIEMPYNPQHQVRG